MKDLKTFEEKEAETSTRKGTLVLEGVQLTSIFPAIKHTSAGKMVEEVLKYAGENRNDLLVAEMTMGVREIDQVYPTALALLSEYGRVVREIRIVARTVRSYSRDPVYFEFDRDELDVVAEKVGVDLISALQNRVEDVESIAVVCNSPDSPLEGLDMTIGDDRVRFDINTLNGEGYIPRLTEKGVHQLGLILGLKQKFPNYGFEASNYDLEHYFDRVLDQYADFKVHGGKAWTRRPISINLIMEVPSDLGEEQLKAYLAKRIARTETFKKAVVQGVTVDRDFQNELDKVISLAKRYKQTMEN